MRVREGRMSLASFIVRWCYSRPGLAVALIAACVFFCNLGAAHLFDEDEPKNAACGAEMFARGDWIVPTFNEDLRTDKPILVYWLMLTSYHVFGVSEFSARFWSAVLGVGSVLLTARIGATLFNNRIGFWAGVALIASPLFVMISRAATPEATLTFCATLATWCFVQSHQAYWKTGAKASGDTSRSDATPLPSTASRAGWTLTYAALGLGLLAKGPVGLVLPLAVFGCFLLFEVARTRLLASASPSDEATPSFKSFSLGLLKTFAPANCWAALVRLRLPLGVAVTLAVALPWYIAVGMATDGAWLEGFFGKHNVQRFVQPLENHKGPIFYHAAALVAGMFPFSLLLPLGLWYAAGKASDSSRDDAPAWSFTLAWSLVYLVFYSLASTKLPHYMTPAYSAYALIAAGVVDAWLSSPAASSKWWPRLAFGGMALGGLGVVVGLGVAARLFMPGEEPAAAVGVALLFGGFVALALAVQNKLQPALASFAIGGVAFTALLFALLPAGLNDRQNSVEAIAAAVGADGNPRPLALYDVAQPSLVFYAHRRVSMLYKRGAVAEFFQANPDGCVFAYAKDLPKIQQELPPNTSELLRRPRFLKKGEVVLLGRNLSDIDLGRTAARSVERSESAIRLK